MTANWLRLKHTDVGSGKFLFHQQFVKVMVFPYLFILRKMSEEGCTLHKFDAKCLI